MSEYPSLTTTMSVDLKKFRIRIYKTVIHQIGDPKYIQLLVNPDEMAVAIRSVEHELSGDQTHRVSERQLRADNSVEIYSRPFISKLCEVVSGLNVGYSYRLSGVVIPAEKTVVFSLKTLQIIES
ncbi:MAG: hypothetical protein PHD46_07665 [Eubacteriales bacterium]|nr:hypothetical protein [Eubacteriales bacterium]